MKAILYGIATMTAFLVGMMLGIVDNAKSQLAINERCEREASVIPESQICLYYGYKDTCKLKPRLAYTYQSRVELMCLYGKRGKAFGR